MPEYRAPGVFVEETCFRHKSIEGVGTTATALAGPTCTGPVRGEPQVVTSFSEFERIYGGCADLDFAGTVVTNYTALAARAFFDNGGRQLYVARVVNGANDGILPTAADYAGEINEVLGSTGLAALESVEDISIVMAPAAVADKAEHSAVLLEIQKHCRKMRYRIGIADTPQGMSPQEVRDFRNIFTESRMALYHPWIVISDPTGTHSELTVPPSGFIAGVYVRTDLERGVHKAPANEVVRGMLRFEQNITKFQQELLNPDGINCLRSFPGRGNRVWGARTLSRDPEWKYVNVRRYFMYLERSIESATRWAVFEPNNEPLWNNLRSSVEDFLYNEWRIGHMQGATPEEAYFVRCDRSTMTQNDLDDGRVVCLIGVAATKPAEFTIFRVAQKSADAA